MINPGTRVVLAAAALWVIAPMGAVAEEDHDALTGLWQGVDNVDGSLRTVSIADLDGDGVFEVRGHDTYWTLCKGPGGLEDVTGTIRDDGVLHARGALACRSGEVVDVETTYTPHGDPEDGMVVEHVVGKPFKTLLFRINRSDD